MFRAGEPRPILGATIALGGPLLVTGLTRIFHPQLSNKWPINVITVLSLKIISLVGGVLIVFGAFHLIHMGIKMMLEKIKNIIKGVKNEFTKELKYHQQSFERQLAEYIKADKKSRNEEMEKFQKEILTLLKEGLDQNTNNTINAETEALIKNFI